jgi:3-oxoadipate enol-lactonase
MAGAFSRLEGDGRPIALLHAGGLDCRMFDRDAEAIARFARVLRYDRSGSGRSPSAARPVDRVRELHHVAVRAFGDDPVVLVGSSFGGQLAIDYALAHPPLVAGLLLVAPGVTGVEAPADVRARVGRLATAAGAGADALADAWLADPHLAPGGLPAATSDLVRTMLADNVELFLAPPGGAPRAPASGRLQELEPPGIVFTGDRDDAHHQALARRLASEAGRLELRRVAGAGHYPSLEREGWLPAVVRGFLGAIDREA